MSSSGRLTISFLFSPDGVGASISAISSSGRHLVGMCVNRERLDHRWIPLMFSCEVARKSPVLEKAREVHLCRKRTASMRCPVGKSQVRMIESVDAAMIQRPSLEKHWDYILVFFCRLQNKFSCSKTYPI